MAQSATDLAPKPAARKMTRAGRGGRAQTPDRAAIPIALTPLLAPYKGRGRLAIRVEQMPPQAWLSAGRNNGDNSWSLGADELDALMFQPPPRFDKTHRLAIRIMVHDGDGVTTAAVLDYDISPDGSGGAQLPDGDAGDADTSGAHDALRAELAAREAALAEARDESEAARAELARAREAWQKDVDARLAEAQAEAARAIEAALAEAEKRWKAADAARLAAAETRWRRETDAAVAEAHKAAGKDRAAGERERSRLADEIAALRKAREASERDLNTLRAEKAMAEAETARAAAAEDQTAREARRRLTDELAELRQTVTARDQALEGLRAQIAKMEAAAAQAQREALRAAEERWKAADAEKLAAVEAQWQAKTDAALAEARAAADEDHRAGETQRRLTDQLAELSQTLTAREGELDAARAKIAALDGAAGRIRAAGDADILRLKEELTRVHKTVQARDDELARMRATLDTEAGAAQARQTALAEAEAQWQAQSAEAIAALEARCNRAEEALAESTNRNSAADIELQRLRGEWTASQDALAEREAELERWRSAAAETTAPVVQGDNTDALTAALAEATARYEAAETALIELRKRSSPQHTMEMARLRDEIDTLQAVLVQRDADLARLRAAADRRYEQETGAQAAGHAGRARTRRARGGDEEAPRPRGMMRDVALVMAVGIAAVLFAPRIVASLPYSWQEQLPAFLTGAGDGTDDAAPAAPPASPKPAKAPPQDTQRDVVTRGVNLRADPSGKAAILSTLKAGTAVGEMGRRENWIQVRVPAAKGGDAAMTGWVYKTYLKPADAAGKD